MEETAKATTMRRNRAGAKREVREAERKTSAVIRNDLIFTLLNATTIQDLYGWEYEELDDMNTSLACQQFIQQIVRANPRDVAGVLALPTNQDEDVWQCEHLRFVRPFVNLFHRYMLYVVTPPPSRSFSRVYASFLVLAVSFVWNSTTWSWS